MGRGNWHPHEELSHVFYVDKDFLNWWWSNSDEPDAVDCELQHDIEDLTGWEYDFYTSSDWYDSFVSELRRKWLKRFKSFTTPWENPAIDCTTDGRVVAFNQLFELQLVDNEWSVAVALIPSDYGIPAFQKRNFPRYCDALRDVLLEVFPSIGTHTGPWTHGTIVRADWSSEIHLEPPF